MIDTPFRPHILLTVAFTVVCLGVPGLRALDQLVTRDHEVTEQRQRGDIHLDAMRTMDAVVTRFLTLLDDYLTSEQDRQPGRDVLDAALNEVEKSEGEYEARVLTLHFSEMLAVSDFEKAWEKCRKVLQNDMLLRGDQKGEEGAANRTELRALSYDIRQATNKLSDATSRVVAERKRSAQEEYREAWIHLAALAIAGLLLEAVLVICVVTVRQRKSVRPQQTGRE
ncbi:hypothetical protein [Couchioplanes caeruleus]|uniref:Chemotaxis methyl-accepting receptor HlyB-like 4HB MCP domain-containing protein n=2 Tax=Couchioplanes caeruleus TaxID=56438 RepID=A0A1K0FCZ9_9ACTN|nr:hypothetical protein [Couchioplanes caeruleus]OJF10709.1 hypothetical protein BG844_30520 [Couchioplanes caeruleus subsp. caeruleus]ROP28174.1 hypothetical protein EDD30_0884 [Couchioplanes caeruleus]